MLFGNRPADKTAKWRVTTRSFAVLLAYTLFIWWLEVLDLLAWLLHVPQGTVLSRAAALVLCGAVMAAIGRFEWDHAGVSPFFIAGSLFILAFFSVKGFAPDQSYDTQNYHLLSQIPGFVDNLHYHVIPGRFQMFGFRLGDRMFYPFRALFGLRMGTMLNALAMLVIYRQVTVFLSMEADRLERKCSWSKHLAPVLAFLIVSRLELIQESGSYMVELLALPFLLEIPAERILGGESGKLYCIVPRDESTSLAVNHVTWESQGNGVWPVADEVLYREEYAQPVLVFVNYEEWPDEPDTEVNLVTNDGLEVKWYPLTDESGCPVVPTGVNYAPMLMDFGIFGAITGLDYPEDWEPAGDDWWLPPTDMGLADTDWVCDDWLMSLHYGDCDPDYAGIAELYHRFEDNTELTRVFSGVWRMEDDCLRLDLSAGVGSSLSGSFPILISPSGEEMHFQRSRSGEGVPFLPDDTDSIDLTRSYG